VPPRPPPLARIHLDRSLPRLLGAPLLIAVAGAGAMVAGAAVGGGLSTLVLFAVGGIALVAALLGAVVLLSVRLDIEEALIRLHWIGGERRYPLARGAVTRVTVRGKQASRLRPAFGAFGWAIGRARLRGEETIDVVRMAPTRTVILVPTEHRRLAIAPRSEGELLEALSDAAQARQRLDELAREPAPATVEVDEPAPDADLEAELHELTGIERAVLEERLAAERGARETGTEPAAPLAVTFAAPAPMAPDVATRPPGPTILARRPRWLSPQLPPALGASMAFILLPLVAAAAIWGIGGALDHLPVDGSDRWRAVTLSLALGGPGTAVGALMARIWWPRIIGVVVTSGLAALVVAARALLGG
jgi:hypothetical protein